MDLINCFEYNISQYFATQKDERHFRCLLWHADMQLKSVVTKISKEKRARNRSPPKTALKKEAIKTRDDSYSDMSPENRNKTRVSKSRVSKCLSHRQRPALRAKRGWNLLSNEPRVPDQTSWSQKDRARRSYDCRLWTFKFIVPARKSSAHKKTSKPSLTKTVALPLCLKKSENII